MSANMLGLDNAATPLGTESDERATGTESEKGHCFQSDDYVFGD
jgi:hypothetical protein